MMKLAWLYREEKGEPWELRSERDSWKCGEWKRIVYCEVED
jgi:hypothetical protein